MSKENKKDILEEYIAGLPPKGTVNISYLEKVSKELDLDNDPEYIAEVFFLQVTETIYQRMEKENIPIEELAKKVGISTKKLKKLLLDGSKITLKLLVKIAIALNSKVSFSFE